MSDCERNDVQVFSGEGELLQIIGPKGDSKESWKEHGPKSVAACADGRIFVANRGAPGSEKYRYFVLELQDNQGMAGLCLPLILDIASKV